MNLNPVADVREFIFQQDYAAKAEENISRLNKDVKAEHDARVTAEKKMEGTEQALVTLAQENPALEAKLEETQKKLEATEAELVSLKQVISQMLTAVFGKSSICVLFLSRPGCFLYVCQVNPTFFL